jgi:hypothetical protein
MAAGDAVFQVCLGVLDICFHVFHLGISNVAMAIYISSVFRCFRRMFQVFHLGISNVAIVIYTCCKRMFHVEAYVSSVSVVLDVCFMCFIWMLHNMHVSSMCFQVFQVFHTYVASVSSGCCICCYGYTCMFREYVSSVSFVLRHMF